MPQEKPVFRIENNILIGKEVPDDQKYPNVGEVLLEKLKSNPDFVAQIDAATGEQNTFGEMRERSVKCAIWLKRQGIQPGDIIGICTDNNLDTYVPVYATLYVAGIVSGWDHTLSVKSAGSFLSLIQPKLVFVNAESAVNLAQAANEQNLEVKIVVMGNIDGFQSLSSIIEGIDSSEVDEFRCTRIKSPEDTAAICWSSGTTGLPKGTELSHRSLLNAVTPTEAVNIVNQVSMWTPTIRWHFGLGLNIEATLSGSKRVIIPDCDDDEGFLRYIQKYQVTYFSCDPCVAMRWAKFGLLEKHSLPSLKKVVVSGAPFRAQKQETVAKLLPHTQFLNCYGLTDAGGLCVSQTKNSKPGSCGFLSKGLRLKVVDRETGVALGANQTGEILIKSPFILKGYYKNPEASKNALTSDGWLRTNDLGYYDDDGEIFVVDRISEFINHRSINLSPSEIESVLECHPSVLKAAVVPVPHEIEEEHPMAFVVKVPGKEVTEEELIKLVADTLPWYCNLRAGVKFMAQLPRTATGKIAKKALKDLAKTFAAKTTAV